MPVRLVKGAYWDTRDQAQPGRAASPTIPCSRARSRPTCPTSPARAGCSRRATSSIRNSRRTMRTRIAASAGRWPARRSATSSSSACTAWARRCYDQIVLPSEQGGLGRAADLRAGRQPRGSAGLSGAAAAGERRQHLLRQPASSTRMLPIEEIVADPVARLRRASSKRHPRIPLPRDLYGPERPNAAGLELADPETLRAAARRTAARRGARLVASAIIDGREAGGPARAVRDPADRRRIVGSVREATEQDADAGARRGEQGGPRLGRDSSGGHAREHLDRAADLFEQHRAELMLLCIREAGQDHTGRAGRGARGRRLPALLRGGRREPSSGSRCGSPGRPARRTGCGCTGAASSPASARGTSRWPSSPVRSRPRWRPATP